MLKSKLQNLLPYLPLFILLAYIILNIVSFWSAEKRELLNNFEDDSYYYFKIAQNVIDHGQFSFDGINATNGFHPLWMLVLLPFAYVFRDPFIFLRAVGVFSILLIGSITYIAFRRIQSRSHVQASYILGAALAMQGIFDFGITGMEVTLLIPLLVLALLMLIRISPWNRLQPNRNRDWLLLGILLALAQLARLDAILFNITVLVFLLWADQSEKKWQHFALVLVPILVTGAGYLTVNYLAFQHLMPTSGLAKSIRGDSSFINMIFIRQMINPANFEGPIWNIFLGMIFVAFGYIFYFAFKRRPSQDGSTKWSNDDYVMLIVSTFFLLFTAYQLFGTSWMLWRWYGYPLYLMSMFVVPGITDKIFDRLHTRPHYIKSIKLFNQLITTFLLLSMLWFGIRKGCWCEPSTIWFADDNYLVATNLNQQLPQPAIFAMGDRAGSFGYFFDGHLIQLEGLVGGYEINQAISTNKLAAYMTKSGVQYVVAQANIPDTYTEWALVTPKYEHTTGPHAIIRLCKKSEILRQTTKTEPIHVWKWPSCTP